MDNDWNQQSPNDMGQQHPKHVGLLSGYRQQQQSPSITYEEQTLDRQQTAQQPATYEEQTLDRQQTAQQPAVPERSFGLLSNYGSHHEEPVTPPYGLTSQSGKGQLLIPPQ
ncbi:MAG TPA: hypothetical protein VH593_13590, partial [Ktedonobacteraceae bacterium]